MNQTIHAAEAVEKHIPAVGRLLPAMRWWRDFLRADDIGPASPLVVVECPPPMREGSTFQRVAHLWRTRDIKLGELYFCSMLSPLWGVWLLLPMHSFRNPAFRLLAFIAPEEIWGLGALGVSFVWFEGVIHERKSWRKFGSAVTFAGLVAVTVSLGMVDFSSTGIVVYGTLAGFVAALRIRQGWETGAGES